jgi:hypothetical protein
MKDQCDVCVREVDEIVGVAASCLGPVSFAFCRECLNNSAEPKDMIEFTIDSCGGLDEVRPEVLDSITYFEDGKYIKMRDFK